MASAIESERFDESIQPRTVVSRIARQIVTDDECAWFDSEVTKVS